MPRPWALRTASPAWPVAGGRIRSPFRASRSCVSRTKKNSDPKIEEHNVCTAKGVVIDPSDFLLEWQAYGHHTAGWYRYYAALRNGVGRDNSQTKSSFGQALGEPGRRCLRGKANNALMAAFMLLRHNVDLLRSWLRKSLKDDEGVIKQATLKNRRGKRRPKDRGAEDTFRRAWTPRPGRSWSTLPPAEGQLHPTPGSPASLPSSRTRPLV